MSSFSNNSNERRGTESERGALSLSVQAKLPLHSESPAAVTEGSYRRAGSRHGRDGGPVPVGGWACPGHSLTVAAWRRREEPRGWPVCSCSWHRRPDRSWSRSGWGAARRFTHMPMWVRLVARRQRILRYNWSIY